MYSLFIVDDEEKIRTGLKSIVNWSELGFELAGEATNGKHALEQMERLGYPDVLMTDIRMPIMDGLALLEEVQRRTKDTQVIILSGYDQFEYVQRALEMKAFDYILKPTKMVELHAKFGKLKEELDRRRAEKTWIDHGKIRETEQWLKRLLIATEEQLHQFREKEIEERCICATVKVKRGTQPYIHMEMLRDKAGRRFAKQLLVPPLIDEKNRIVLIMVVGTDAERAAVKKAEAIANQMLDVIKLEGGSSHIGIGSVVARLTAIGTSYRQSVKALEQSFFEQKSAVFVQSPGHTPYGSADDGSAPLHMAEYEKGWLQAVTNGDAPGAERRVEDMFLFFMQQPGATSARIIERCIGMVLYASRQLKLEADGCVIPEGWDHINELRQWVLSSTAAMCDAVRERQKPGKGRIVDHLESIVASRYRESLQLQDIAESLQMNPDYLSRLFREKTGVSFVQYLTQYRIEKAKELLEDISCKSYEVGHLVGFQNPSYFSKTFKKFTGLSVSDYRDRYGSGAQRKVGSELKK